MKVLVITTLPDPHLEMVSQHLNYDTEIAVFDPYSFPNDEMFSVLFNREETVIKTKAGSLNDISSVWFRKPLLLREDMFPVQEQYRKAAFRSYKEGVTWLYSAFPNSFWVSDYWAIKKASSKIVQLMLANRLGFLVPETLVTSSPEEAKRFLESKRDAVVKPLNIEFIQKFGKINATYTTKITDVQTIDFTGLSISPAIFQQEINGADVRVTVVGLDVFACAIEKQGKTNLYSDWRVGINDNTIKITKISKFPSILAQMCVNMNKQLGLQFGAYDFIKEAKTDKYWFLELNPNGQWAFVELATGLPISKSIARLLTSGSI